MKENGMTREERNNKLKYFITCMKCEVSGKSCDENCPTQYEAGHMGEIIENLEEISKILEKEPCEDIMTIHTQGLDEGIRCAMCTNSMKSDRGCDGGCVVNEAMYKEVMNTIRNHIVPPVTPTRKKGKWKEYPHEWGDNWQYSDYECSICHDRTHFDTNFCPNCGSFMMKED